MLESEIAIFVGNHIRKYGSVPTLGNLIQEKGFLMVMINMRYIMGLIYAGMIRLSFMPEAQLLIACTK
ncbi:MAG: hypothetical protein K6G22_05910 [Lachnospiraceae bacterium]|nr:hypothetical protein [Lachnospiraceae bacterium]